MIDLLCSYSSGEWLSSYNSTRVCRLSNPGCRWIPCVYSLHQISLTFYIRGTHSLASLWQCGPVLIPFSGHHHVRIINIVSHIKNLGVHRQIKIPKKVRKWDIDFLVFSSSWFAIEIPILKLKSRQRLRFCWHSRSRNRNINEILLFHLPFEREAAPASEAANLLQINWVWECVDGVASAEN